MKVALDARHAGRGLGIATFVTQLARELAAVDDLELVWLGDAALAPAAVSRSIPIDRVPYPILDGPLGRALLRRHRVDVIHFTGNTGWGRRGPVPSVLTVQDLIFLKGGRAGRGARQLLGHAYERRLIPHAVDAADAVAVSSHTVADELRAWLGGDLTPHVIPLGVEAPPTGTGSAPPSTPYLVAFAGRDPRKRTADVVAAWRSLESRSIGLRLLASAGLPPGLRESLEPEIRAGTVEVSEQLPRADVWRLLAGALALVYASADEGFGLPVLEAMAAGTPVLAGLAPVTLEVGGDAIVVLDPGDVPGSVAAAVRRLQGDPVERRRLIDAGRRRAATFSWRRTATAYAELYRTVAGRTP